jgi:hypothetical protein
VRTAITSLNSDNFVAAATTTAELAKKSNQGIQSVLIVNY